MINRELLNAVIDKLDVIGVNNEVSLTMNNDSKDKYTIGVSIYPRNWWSGYVWTDEERHAALALMTPLVGKLTKEETNGSIGYEGAADGVTVSLNRVQACKILGYKIVKKTVKKEIEKPVEYEEVEEEERIAITDCDVKQGRASESDVEVPA